VASRGLAFSDPEVIRLVRAAFVPVAENCSYLQRQQDAEGDFFRLVAEQGHYGGRVLPSDTRQGQYACTADGVLLASCNTREAPRLLEMLRSALARWEDVRSRSGPGSAEEPTPALDPRYLRVPPEGGLILRVYARDLPREDDRRPADWRTRAVNFDHAWFTREEAAALVPAGGAPGTTAAVPAPLARRIARFHLVDNVRGETPMWRREDVLRCELRTTVVGREGPGGERLRVRLEGDFLCRSEGSWAVRPFGEHLPHMERGIQAELVGWGVWDREAACFVALEAVAVGTRWGGTEHNCRWDDLEPAPIGIWFELADGSAPGDRTPPQGSGSGYWDP
jgi:hypothetical protein